MHKWNIYNRCIIFLILVLIYRLQWKEKYPEMGMDQSQLLDVNRLDDPNVVAFFFFFFPQNCHIYRVAPVEFFVLMELRNCIFNISRQKGYNNCNCIFLRNFISHYRRKKEDRIEINIWNDVENKISAVLYMEPCK